MSVNSILPPYSASTFSSPPSSPNPFTDSSPASSPGFASAYQDDDDIPEITLPHPLAASSNANWRPPQYEKKRPILSVSPPPPERQLKKLKHTSFDPSPHAFLPSSSPVSPTFPQTPKQLELEKWDAASARVFDDNHGLVTLDHEGLTFIPLSFLDDLNKFYVPPEDDDILINTSPRSGNKFSRTLTVPPGQLFAESRTFSRSRSAAHASFGVPRDRIQLHLSNNSIKSLPLAICRLENLSILSLRSNKLTYLPPEINQLKHLHTLNVSNNRLEYLPSELLQMDLKQLLVNPNPFLPPPLTPDELPLTRPVSDPKYLLPEILPLSELCLRILLSSRGANSEELILEGQYDRYLQQIPQHIKEYLYLGCPWVVDFEEKDLTLGTGVGLCPSPLHQGETGPGTGLFLRPAVERFTWEKIIAGQSIGGLVPVKWRGCLHRCLDFLSPPRPSLHSTEPNTSMLDEDWDMDTNEAVQVMSLAPVTFGDDEGFDI